ncbi:MAG: transglutaminase domain-containing protein [Nitrospinae bacterium]|nr:transglutaminase domain-containing protein [Nitrospinota bacterium]
MRRNAAFPAAVFLLLFSLSAFAETIADEWMELQMNGKKIGFSHQKVTKDGAGYRIESKAVIKMEMGGVEQDLSTSSAYFLDADFRPLRFTYMQKMLNHRQFFEGVVHGNEMAVTVESAGAVSRKTVPLEDQVYVADTMALLLGKKKLRGGEKFSFRVFLEPLLASETMGVEVGALTDLDIDGKKAKVFPVTMKLKGFVTVSYITPEGRVLREISPMGFVSRAVGEKQALDFPLERVSFTGLLAYSLIPVAAPVENAGAVTLLRARITGIGAPDLLPEDDRQKTVSAEKAAGKNGAAWAVTLEVRKNRAKNIARVNRPAPAARFGEFMKPTFEAQSDDPAIIAKAAEITGAETDMYRAAVKINRWVFTNVKKKYIDTFSGVATLKSLEGECQSHTNLFAALAKAAGIPVKTVSGIVYAPDYKGFLYHAWPEVWAGEWVAMDPTFGQDIADATHIKLTDGDLSVQLQLFEFIGKIGLEPLETGR